jgi:14-3-3 protein epsilon
MSRDENVFMARIAEQSERYEDMAEYMKRVASMAAELSFEERNLLSVAYKNSVGACRTAWRQVKVFEASEMSKGGQECADIIAEYRKKIEDKLHQKCNEIIGILQTDLIPKASSPEATVFYLKMKGDYHRYLAEFSVNAEREQVLIEAQSSYSAATEQALALSPVHPIRLGLALNFSVFYYEVFQQPAYAIQLAHAAFVEANALASSLTEDSAQIVELLKDNLALWQSADPGGSGRAPEQDGTLAEDL